jgi:predicted RNase H-like nuclease (RuvC/YqgF family)
MSRIGSLLAALREVRAQRERIEDLERELVRISPQLAALEQRLEELRVRLDRQPLTAEPGEVAEARSVLDEVRAEHARVRARISAATVFEERLRVLEERAGGSGAAAQQPADPAGG